MRHNRVNELLLALYLGFLGLSKFFINAFPSNSFLVLLIPTIAILGVSVVLNFRSQDFKVAPLLISLITLVVLSINYAFFWNDSTFSYIYDFMIYGAIPLFLLSRISELGVFFKYFAYIGVVTVILLGLDPLNAYALTTDYMVYGYFIMLPAYAGLYVARKYYGIRWLIVFELLAFILILAFANRGAGLAAIALILLSNVFVDKLSPRRILSFMLTGVLAVAALLNINPILEWSMDVAKDAGQSSYALEKVYDSINGTADGLSGRDSLWSQAQLMFDSRPLTGHGVAAFESANGIYAHNIFLEVLVSFGFFGLVLFSGYIIYYVYRMLKENLHGRLPFVLGLSIGLVPLIFSMQPFIWYAFWIFFANPDLKIKVLPRKRIRVLRRIRGE